MRERVIHLVYRSLFATSYVLSSLSASLAAVYLSLGAIFCFGLLGRWLSPTGPLDSEPGKGGTVESPKALARMAYPCAYMSMSMFHVYTACIQACTEYMQRELSLLQNNGVFILRTGTVHYKTCRANKI